MDNTQISKELENQITATGNSHLLQVFKELESPNQKQHFLQDLQRIDFQLMLKVFFNKENNNANKKVEINDIFPFKNITKLSDLSSDQKNQFRTVGYDMIINKKVCVIFMAAGSGTRLGYEKPKGTYNFNFPSQKSIFQYHCERILKVQQLTYNQLNVELQQRKYDLIQLFIMTCLANNQETQTFFQEHKYFGLNPQCIHFFQQGDFPAIDKQGRVMLTTKEQISQCPNGNGAIFAALISNNLIEKMKQSGIQVVHVLGVDNIMSKPAEPLFIGFQQSQKLEIASKFVQKINASENVGIFVTEGKSFGLAEYTELSETQRNAVDQNGNLIFAQANIVNIIYSIDFLDKIKSEIEKQNILYHVQKKIIPYYDTDKQLQITQESLDTLKQKKQIDFNCYKFEIFFSDVFKFTKSMAILECNRNEEFAPIKNKDGVDSPSTARALLSQLNISWLKNLGLKIYNENQYLEISPLVSYEGEGLEKWVMQNKSKEIELPFEIKIEIEQFK